MNLKSTPKLTIMLSDVRNQETPPKGDEKSPEGKVYKDDGGPSNNQSPKSVEARFKVAVAERIETELKNDQIAEILQKDPRVSQELSEIIE